MSFFVNMSVLWFGAAFVAPASLVVFTKGMTNGATALICAMLLAKEVDRYD